MLRTRVSDQLLMQVILQNPGASDEDLGGMLNLSRVQVSRRKNSPEFQILLKRHFNSSIELLRVYQSRAVLKICELLDSKDERTVLKAAEMIMGQVPIEESKDRSQLKRRLSELIDRIRQPVEAKQD